MLGTASEATDFPMSASPLFEIRKQIFVYLCMGIYEAPVEL
jgi:hypothetical protein